MYYLIQILKEISFCKDGEPDQTPRFAASDLVLHCLPMFHKRDAKLIWLKDLSRDERVWA